MGFIRGNMIPILKESKRQPFTGHVLFLGHPDIYFDYQHLLRMAKIARVSLDMSVPIKPSPKPDFAAKQYLAGDTVFKMLGFEQISVLDYSDFEGANIVFDLNSTELPSELIGKFDVVVDHGTLEHVFHLPNALSNIHRLLKTGGRAITSSPSTNFLDHGFYMFQPTLFVDYYAANNWVVESIQVVQFTHNQETEPCFFADYEPGLFDSVGYGKMDNKLYSTICVATKTIDSTSSKIPQQGWYKRLANWKPSESAINADCVPIAESSGEPMSGLGDRVRKFFTPNGQ